MAEALSARLRSAVDALPLHQGMRVLEIGCGPGAASREVARRIGDGHVHGIDRSSRAIALAVAGSDRGMADRLSFQQVAVEAFELAAGEQPFDLAFAIRVGALDGRHPELAQRALVQLARALTPTGRLFVDIDNAMVEVSLPR